MPDPFLSLFPTDPGLPEAVDDQMPQDSDAWRCPGDELVHPLAGSSYTYNASLAGRTLDETWFVRRLGMNASEFPVAYDVDGNTFALDGTPDEISVPFFHDRRNLLFADGHVGNYD
jgi:prepilin-type processing-associated H-X9-DG protein